MLVKRVGWRPAGVVQVHLLLAPLQTELAAAEELKQLRVIYGELKSFLKIIGHHPA